MKLRVVSFFAALTLLTFNVNVQAQDGPIKIGVLLPYSGVFAGLGKEMDNAVDLALETFGTEAGGRAIEIVREDTETKPNIGLAKAKKLVFEDKVDVVVGIVSSGVAGAVRDFMHKSEVPLVIANAGNDLLTGENCTPWVIRASFSNSQINSVMGPILAEQGKKKAFLMAFDYAAGHQMMDAFRETFVAAGGEIVGEEYPPLGETKDFGPYLAKLKAAEPDVAYVFFAGGPAIKFVTEYDAFGLRGNIPLAGPGWLTSALYLAKQGDAALGTQLSLNYVPSIDTPENKAFQDAFKAKYERGASEFAVQAYDSIHLIIEGLKATGGKTDDKKALADALRSVSFVGPRGPLKIDAKTNNVIQDVYIYEIQKDGDGVKPVIMDVIKDVQDEPKGCVM